MIKSINIISIIYNIFDFELSATINLILFACRAYGIVGKGSIECFNTS